jgi:ABC-type multidrug transport system ATPase subunit
LRYLPDPSRQVDFTLTSRVNLIVEAGKCVLIKGDNGTGKSTFLDFLSGRRHQTMELDPEKLRSATWIESDEQPAFRQASSVEARPSLLPHITIKEYLRHAKHVRNEEITDALLMASLAVVGLPQRILPYTPESLSAGQRKKVGLAIVWLMKSPLIVLDEPRANLDYPSKPVMDEYIQKLKDEGRVIVIASHDDEDCPFADHYCHTACVGKVDGGHFELRPGERAKTEGTETA